MSMIGRVPTTMSASPAMIGATRVGNVGGAVLVVGVGVDDDVGAEAQTLVEAGHEDARARPLLCPIDTT